MGRALDVIPRIGVGVDVARAAALERKMNVVRSFANKFRRQTTIFRSSKYW